LYSIIVLHLPKIETTSHLASYLIAAQCLRWLMQSSKHTFNKQNHNHVAPQLRYAIASPFCLSVCWEICCRLEGKACNSTLLSCHLDLIVQTKFGCTLVLWSYLRRHAECLSNPQDETDHLSSLDKSIPP